MSHGKFVCSKRKHKATTIVTYLMAGIATYAIIPSLWSMAMNTTDQADKLVLVPFSMIFIPGWILILSWSLYKEFGREVITVNSGGVKWVRKLFGLWYSKRIDKSDVLSVKTVFVGQKVFGRWTSEYSLESDYRIAISTSEQEFQLGRYITTGQVEEVMELLRTNDFPTERK
jgi:hypothetical protein